MRLLKLLFPLMVVFVALAPMAEAQNRTRFGGRYNVLDYAYGVNPNVPALQVATGNTATGTASITIVLPCVALGDGTTLCPLSTVAPILVGTGSTQDSVTPTALSNCSYQGAGYGACTVTASFTYTHGTGDNVTTASLGLQEAINAALGNGGGTVVTDRSWQNAGGTTAKITSATGYWNVAVEDTRSGDQFWSLQPSTLTSLAVPTTLTATTVVFAAAPVGTWAASAYYFCVTYVDALGGEGPCSLTYNQTPTLNYSVTITAPAASTGAVGWRAYAGASYNAAYLLPITSTNCTLTTLEGVMPACAMGANAVFLAPNTTWTILRPNATVTAGALASPTVNIVTPQPQGHTTMAYAPAGNQFPQYFQTHYGPFPQFGSLTSGQVSYLGSVNLPTGFLNTIGRTIRISGKVVLGTVNTSTLPAITITTTWNTSSTNGVGTTGCTFGGAAVGSSTSYNGTFSCTMTTNAVGTTAVGTVMTDGQMLIQQVGQGSNTALGPYIDTQTAVVGSLGLQAQDTINVVYTSATNSTGTEQLMDLHVEILE